MNELICEKVDDDDDDGDDVDDDDDDDDDDGETERERTPGKQSAITGHSTTGGDVWK